MKRWDEVKAGDYIYYYDHYKIHKQLVHDVNEETEESSYTDWFGKKITNNRKRIIIKAGKGSYFKVYDLSFERHTLRINGMVRFASIEAANEYVNGIVKTLKKRVEKSRLQYEKRLNQLNKHGYETDLIS